MWKSLKRGAKRNFTIIALATLLIQLTENFPMMFGPVLAPFFNNIGLVLLAFSGADIIIRIFQPYIDTEDVARRAINSRLDEGAREAASRVYLARNILFCFILLMLTFGAKAQTVDQHVAANAGVQDVALKHPVYRGEATGLSHAFLKTSTAALPASTLAGLAKMPKNAQKNYKLLLDERAAHWKTMLQASLLGAQVEQETCPSLVHSKCWTADAHLNITSKNGTERGAGFGQLTKVVRANGQLRFDNLSMMSLRYPKELGKYSWDNWNDPQLSMRAYVLFMRDTCKAIKNAATELDMFQMCLSAYNGGQSGLNNDILSCRATKGCDPTRWKGNVEHTSSKSRTVVPGYGQPAFKINRGYVDNVTGVRRARYLVLDKFPI